MCYIERVSGQLPPVRVRVWVRVSVGGQFLSGANVLEPLKVLFFGEVIFILDLT